MNFWVWLWLLLASLPWGLVGMALTGSLLAVVGLLELKWRLLHGVGAFSFAREEFELSIDWRVWVAAVTMVCVLCISMFGFYAVQVEGSARLPIGWQDGRLFLLCASLASWIFGVVIFKLLKAEIDWRLTAALCMLGSQSIASGGSWLRLPERLELLPHSAGAPK